MSNKYDVIIVGGSFAGLAAALQLVRARKNVLVLDVQKPRNIKAHESHGFLTQDGTPPLEILSIGRDQLEKYDTFHLLNELAVSAEKLSDNEFRISTDNADYFSKRVIIASGVKDLLPEIKGLNECWGVTAFFCPYCHGYEFRDQIITVIDNHVNSMHQAMLLTEWTDKLNWITQREFTTEEQVKINEKNINVIRSKIKEIFSENNHSKYIEMESGEKIETQAIVLAPAHIQVTPLAKMLGCEIVNSDIMPEGLIKVDEKQQTSVKGVYSAGDASNMMSNVASSVYFGTWAGASVHQSMVFE